MTEKALSRSDQLIINMHFAALRALARAPDGQLRARDLKQAIETSVPLDDWARTVYESTGNVRWRAIFAFASVGLVKGGYVTKSQRIWTITDEGRGVLARTFKGREFLDEVDQRYRAWERSQIASESASPSAIDRTDAEDAITLEGPEERMDRTIKAAHTELAAELIERLKQSDPAFFENVVVQLLLRMGYGGSRQEAGRAVGRSGDGGIDGIINEDRLGLDAIYIQAKRWDGSVGEGPVRDFFGALDIKGVKKGVLITTGQFTAAATKAVGNHRSDKRIVLIDGARLAELMIEHDLGVAITTTYVLKRLDADFFAED